MSEPIPSPAPAPLSSPANRSPAAPLFCWLVIQLIALSLGVFRVPLAASWAPPGEQFAIHVVLVTQIVASALLFPFLLRNATTSAMAILSIAPFVQLSAFLSGTPMSRAALATLYVAIWLVTLAVWRGIMQSRCGEMLAVACALAMSVGGAVIWYVRAESREPGPTDGSRDGLFGPILGVIAQLHESSTSSWIAALVLLLASAALFLAARKREVGRSGERPATS